jgi:TRAP-type C4-dicarboxylate transport system permease small subunit
VAVFLPYALFSPSHKALRGRKGKKSRHLGHALAENVANAYIEAMQKLAILVPLLLFLAASVWFTYYVWATDNGPPMPASGYVAMILGVLFSLVVGIGLMALIFYSNRHGYDDGHGGEDGT